MAVSAGLYKQDKDAETGLTARQRQVLHMLTREDNRLTQQQAAEELGVSRQRVHQIVRTLLERGHWLPGMTLMKTVSPK